jgi:hypothetical protein
MSEQQDTKYKVGDLVYGFMSGLGVIVAVELREIEGPNLYLVKHMETGEENWHIENGIDKMKKMYDDWIAGKPVDVMFENLLKNANKF